MAAPTPSTINVEAHPCGEAGALQAFTHDNATGLVKEATTGMCVTVAHCGTSPDTNVVLQPCGSDACDGAGQRWTRTPPALPSGVPGVEFELRPATSSAMCLEIPNGGPNVDVYNCEDTYPKAILHEIWTVGTAGSTLQARSGQCLTAVPPPKPYGPLPPVWPLPASWSTHTSSPPTPVRPSFAFKLPPSAPARLTAAATRYRPYVTVNASSTASGGLASCTVAVHTTSAALTLHTSYNYTLTVNATACRIVADTMYGAMYGMETLAQLAFNGTLPHTVAVDDYPQFRHRGLMVDSGRRFFPMPLLLQLLDGMAANKLNVLHLHASDYCRWSVESKAFPNLTRALTGLQAGHYTQSNVSALLAYAADRGIRVVPEFDVPGHSAGFRPLQHNVTFCTSHRKQLYNDPAGVTVATLKALFGEMAALFPDVHFHVGADETAVVGPCTLDNIRSLETDVIHFLNATAGKTVVAWEEALFTTGSTTPATTVIDDWSRHTPAQSTAAGYRSVASASGHFYLNHASLPLSATWTDIADGVPAAKLGMVLGGEASLWSDNYCYINQCTAAGKPVAAALYGPQQDAVFARSAAGMVWPRAHAAAGSFYRFQPGVNATSPAFHAAMARQNAVFTARGLDVCPSGCTCDELTRCGKPYLPSAPPAAAA